jgi:hypothetical protein
MLQDIGELEINEIFFKRLTGDCEILEYIVREIILFGTASRLWYV